MTNHHCVVECVAQLSTKERNFQEEGFSAKKFAGGAQSADFELDQLVEIRDVTKDVSDAVAGKTGEDANKALNAKRAELQQSCGSDKSVRCDLVSLYHGGIYDLYRYKRYNDVRLVFAPEFSVAQFGAAPTISIFPASISISAWFAPTKMANQRPRPIICAGAPMAPKMAILFSLPATPVAPAAASPFHNWRLSVTRFSPPERRTSRSAAVCWKSSHERSGQAEGKRRFVHPRKRFQSLHRPSAGAD